MVTATRTVLSIVEIASVLIAGGFSKEVVDVIEVSSTDVVPTETVPLFSPTCVAGRLHATAIARRRINRQMIQRGFFILSCRRIKVKRLRWCRRWGRVDIWYPGPIAFAIDRTSPYPALAKCFVGWIPDQIPGTIQPHP